MQPKRSAVLRHEVVSETLVLVTMRPAHGVGSALMVSPTEAKRFAWALLADLDPDEVDEAVIPTESAPIPVSYGRLGPKSKMPERIKDALRTLRQASSTEIAAEINSARGSVLRACATMIADGVLRKSGTLYSLAPESRP